MKGKMLLVFGLVLVFAFALSFAVSSATETPDFPLAPSSSWPGNDVGATSGDARAVVAGDLENDGDDDLASGDANGMITIWQNDGTPFTGQWISKTIGNCGAAVNALALADFDNDGDLDLAAGCDGAAAWEVVVAQSGAKPFADAWAFNGVGGAANVLALAVGDLDNDGWLDLVSGDSGAVIDAWRNDHTPFSGAWTSQIVGNTTNAAYAVALGDLDNDGDLDLASGDANKNIKVWNNSGSPFSGAWNSNTARTGKDTINTVALADLDGDGRLDIVSDIEYLDATNYQVATWQNDGSPFAGFWTGRLIGASDSAVNVVTPADLNNDGKVDVASGSSASGSYEVVVWYNPASPFADTWTQENVGASTDDVYGVALADLDHDSKVDIVSGSGNLENYQVIAWQNTNTTKAVGSWTAIVQPSPAYKAWAVAAADFNHDGKTDLAAGHQDQGVFAWRGDGGSTWTRVGATKLPITDTWRDVAWGQINNRTDIDLAAARQNGGLKAWLAWEGGGDWDDRSTGLPTSGDYYAVAQGDVDHDGLLDLAAGGVGVGVRAWRGLGSGPPYWDPKTMLSGTLDFCDVALGHVNHDGDLDIVAANCDDLGVRVWSGDGGFGFTHAAFPTSTGSYTALALGDLNNDGDTDVAAADKGGVRIWLGNGGSGWAYAGIISPSLTVLGLDLGDYNHDGQLDLVLGLQNDGVRVLRGRDGTSWTDASLGLPAAGTFEDVKFGRVDADAMLDIVAAESGASGVRVWTAFEPPPGGWDNFEPTSWNTTQAVTASVQVIDTGSGLDVNTAEYRFSNTGPGGLTNTWFLAACSGAISTTTAQTITASGVSFNWDSATQNAIQFRIRDMAGLTGTSPIYNVLVDSTPPGNPAGLSSTSHTVGAWSNDDSISFTWTHTGTDNVSGVDGYSFLLNQTAVFTPDHTIDRDAGPPSSPVIGYASAADGDWYFHLTTRDMAGNWSAPAHLGPYRIDTTNPTTPTLTSSSPNVGIWSHDNTVFVQWSSSDGGSISGYSFAWDDHPTLYVDTITDTASNSTTSSALADDQWYLHVRAIDQAGNAGGTAHFGPFNVDTADPYSCWINAPATCGSSCTIEWSYYDATSGVAEYDVQVRYEDAATPTWENWLLGTASTSAVYTDTGSSGTYSFRVRATDWASNASGYDCSDQTIVANLQAHELEVTQGIQNLDNDVPLIADKTTYVRFYVASQVDVPNVNARLHGTRGGAALPGSPLSPTGGRITTHVDAGDRDDLNDSFYFRLPSDWRSGTVTLRAVVNPSHDVAETSYTDNEISETVTFGTSGDFCMVMVPIHLHPHTYFIEDHNADFWSMVGLMKWLYPVRNDGVGIYSVGEEYPEWHWAGWEYGIDDDYDVILQDLEGVDFWTSDPCHDTHYWGMVHPDSFSGGSIGMGQRYNNYVNDCATGVMAVSIGSIWPTPVGGGAVMAHELGHNFRRKHVLCTGDESGGGEVDDTYPYPDRPPCRIGPDDPAGYYGFLPRSGGTPEIVAPVGTGDLMSYADRTWPSDWTYRALFNELRDLARVRTLDVPPAVSPAWAQATEYLFASGLISPTGQTAELQAFYRTSSPDSKFVARSFQQEIESAQSDNVYSLVLQDVGGNILYTHTFTAAAMTNQGASTKIGFAEVFPYDNRTTLVVLKQGITTLASRQVSSHVPVITLLYPNGGETINDSLIASWTGSDADGDTLRYTIQYSSDDGATWRSLVIDWVGTSFAVTAQSLNLLPGSNRARIRVTATDGVNTASDQSDATFTLARKPPLAHILEPLGGSEFKVGDTIVFMGTGMDAEDGPLGATSVITWTTSLSGTLGVGTELWVSDLLTGTHRVTMTVTDSDGNVGTDEVIVFVGVSPEKIYLPIVLKN